MFSKNEALTAKPNNMNKPVLEDQNLGSNLGRSLGVEP